MGAAAPIAIGLGMGALNAVSSASSSAMQTQQMLANAKAQAAQMQAQANAMRQNAENQRIAGEMEAKKIDERKTEIRKEYNDIQSKNRTLLASANVDLSTGSAADIAEGNINNFAADLSENAYAKAVKEWETRNNYNRAMAEANYMNASADYTRRAANAQAQSSQGASVLNALISGAGGFMTGYGFAGGKFPSLFSSSGAGAGGRTIADFKRAAAATLLKK